MDGLILVIEPLVDGQVECLFAVVHNEDRAKWNAQQAIKESDLFFEKSEVFSADWIFDNKKELSEYVFNYYNLPFDSTLANKMYEFLSVNVQRRPIKVVDSMIIQALSKLYVNDEL